MVYVKRLADFPQALLLYSNFEKKKVNPNQSPVMSKKFGLYPFGAPLRSFAPAAQGTVCPNSLPQAATDSSLLLTHNKNSTDKSLCCFCGAP